VRELLEMETVKATDIALVLPPALLSCGSIDILSEQLKIDRDRFAHVTDPGKDLFTSSLSYALDAVRSRELAKPGDIGLLISVGAGIDVGCALYYF
jgi:3-oxoacyl-[acyl-carrier-protein] synthase III